MIFIPVCDTISLSNRRNETDMRVLIAEDERALARALVQIFEKNHYSADAVYHGEDALLYLSSGN